MADSDHGAEGDGDGLGAAEELRVGKGGEVEAERLQARRGVVSVVVPPELHQKLAAMAKAEGCSLEQLAIAILERGFFGVSPPG